MLLIAKKNEGEMQEREGGSRACSYDVYVCCRVRWGRRCARDESSCSLTIMKFMRAEEVKLHIFTHTPHRHKHSCIMYEDVV